MANAAWSETREQRHDRLADHSRRYLDLERPVEELASMATLAALAFEFIFDTEVAEADGGDFVFRIAVPSFRAIQHGLDEIRERARKIHEDF